MNMFYRRTPITDMGETTTANYSAFISSILTTVPTLTLKDTSNLAAVAVDQYNKKVKTTATLVRPPIPSWFCGYQDTESGQLYLSEFEIDSNRIKNINSSVTLTAGIFAASSVRYESDKCLALGIPGSYWYSFCELTSGFDIPREIDVIDWSTAFYPTSAVTDMIQQITQAVYDEAQSAIGNFASLMTGGEGGGGEGGGGGEEGGEGDLPQTGSVKLKSAQWSNKARHIFTFSLDPANPNWPQEYRGDALCMFSIIVNGKKCEWARKSQRSVDLGSAGQCPRFSSGESFNLQIGDIKQANRTNSIKLVW